MEAATDRGEGRVVLVAPMGQPSSGSPVQRWFQGRPQANHDGGQGFPISILMIVASGWYLYKFFHPDLKQKKQEQAQTEGQSNGNVPAQADRRPDPTVSDQWRLIGTIYSPRGLLYMLSDGSGRVRYIENPPAAKFGLAEIELALPSGEVVTRWTGSQPSFVERLAK